MILDSHPSLLTVAFHGLSSFVLVWKIFCEGKFVKDAIDHMRKPNDERETKLLNENLDIALRKSSKDSRKIFLDKLTNYLNPDKKYGMSDWFKAFYLSINEAVGRKFNQRIAPAIFWDKHGMNQHGFCRQFNIDLKDMNKMEQTVSDGFKHLKRIGVVRSPFTNFGCVYGALTRSSNPSVAFEIVKRFIQGYEYWCFEKFYGRYLNSDDPNFEIMRQVRFEDLKLYPQETTEKLCEFLRIPWSETCLHITTNGEDSGFVDGTAGFDTRPVFNPHSEHLSSFDFYRIELLNFQNFSSVWGYKPKFYDGMKYSREELEKLYAIPFKIETQKLEKYPDWPNEKQSKEFHEWILARAIDVMENGEKQPVDSDGKPMRLVECDLLNVYSQI